MSTAIELKPSALAERIAKVRNCMLAVTLTEISPPNKELFTALCQTNEQHNAEKFSFSGELFDELPLPLHALFFAHELQENTRQRSSKYRLRTILSQQQEGSVSSDFSDNSDEDETDLPDRN